MTTGRGRGRMRVGIVAAAMPVLLFSALTMSSVKPTTAAFTDDAHFRSTAVVSDSWATRLAHSTALAGMAADGTRTSRITDVATSWTTTTSPTPTFRPTWLDANGGYFYAANATQFARYNGTSWTAVALPPGQGTATNPLIGILAVYDGRNQVAILITQNGQWWYNLGTGGWIDMNETANMPTSVVDLEGNLANALVYDGTNLKRSTDFANNWTDVTTPPGGVKRLGYSAPYVLVWNSQGWFLHANNGISGTPWVAVPALNAIGGATDIAGGSNNSFLIGQGKSVWRYVANATTATQLSAPY